jgi:hypothetical protein
MKPLGLNENGEYDTLSSISIGEDNINLGNIDAAAYAQLKFNFTLESVPGGESPSIESVGARYKNPAELAINYQVVEVLTDTVMQGAGNKLFFYVYNLGETAANQFDVTLDLIKPDNSYRHVETFQDISIDPDSKKRFESKIILNASDGWGDMSVVISIDNDNSVREFYDDNNSYRIPFYVKEDTTITSISSAEFNVTFDGYEISDGDYVSPNPEIEIKLRNPNSIQMNDTSSMAFYFDGIKIHSNDLLVDGNNSPDTKIFKYTPQLENGSHFLKLYGVNESGILDDYPGFEKVFEVSDEIELLDVYNYPNPFSNNTNFTFQLTQVPDELKIKIYTVAGRLIKVLETDGNQLKTNFNSIVWDGRDEDGDMVSNGVYLYKIIARSDEKTTEIIQKLAVVR